MSCWMRVTSPAVRIVEYLVGTIRSCVTDACAAFEKRSPSAGSASRGRSVQANPLAASKRAGALRTVAGPICFRIARSSVCWRAIRP